MIWVFLLLAAMLIAITFWGRTDVRRFLKTHSSMDGESLVEFKNLVRRNMRVAIAAMVIGLIWGLTAAGLAWQLGIVGVLIVLVVGAPVMLLGRSTKKLEVMSRSLPCADPQLEAEYRKVGSTWTSKAFPDF